MDDSATFQAGASRPDAAASAAASPPSPGLPQSLLMLWRELPGLLSDRVELLGLELRKAGADLLQTVLLLMAAAILGMTAWLGLWAGVVVALWSMGLHLMWALFAVMAINLLAAVALLLTARGITRRPHLAATRRHMTPKTSLEPRSDERNDPAPAPAHSHSHARPHAG